MSAYNTNLSYKKSNMTIPTPLFKYNTINNSNNITAYNPNFIPGENITEFPSFTNNPQQNISNNNMVCIPESIDLNLKINDENTEPPGYLEKNKPEMNNYATNYCNKLYEKSNYCGTIPDEEANHLFNIKNINCMKYKINSQKPNKIDYKINWIKTSTNDNMVCIPESVNYTLKANDEINQNNYKEELKKNREKKITNSAIYSCQNEYEKKKNCGEILIYEPDSKGKIQCRLYPANATKPTLKIGDPIWVNPNGEPTKMYPYYNGKPTKMYPYYNGKPNKMYPYYNGKPNKMYPYYNSEPTKMYPYYNGEPTKMYPNYYNGEPTKMYPYYNGEPTKMYPIKNNVSMAMTVDENSKNIQGIYSNINNLNNNIQGLESNFNDKIQGLNTNFNQLKSDLDNVKKVPNLQSQLSSYKTAQKAYSTTSPKKSFNKEYVDFLNKISDNGKYTVIKKKKMEQK